MKRFSWLVLLFCLGVLAYFHPYFTLETIRFSGYNFLSSTQLRSQARPFIGGNILSVAYWPTFRDEMLAAFPQIDHLALRLDLPGQLQVDIVEKAASLSLLMAGDSVLLAQDGSILSNGDHNVRVDNLDDLFIVRGVPESFLAAYRLQPLFYEFLMLWVNSARQHLPVGHWQIVFTGLRIDSGLVFFDEVKLLYDDTLQIFLHDLHLLDRQLGLLDRYLSGVSKARLDALDYIDLRVNGRVITANK